MKALSRTSLRQHRFLTLLVSIMNVKKENGLPRCDCFSVLNSDDKAHPTAPHFIPKRSNLLTSKHVNICRDIHSKNVRDLTPSEAVSGVNEIWGGGGFFERFSFPAMSLVVGKERGRKNTVLIWHRRCIRGEKRNCMYKITGCFTQGHVVRTLTFSTFAYLSA